MKCSSRKVVVVVVAAAVVVVETAEEGIVEVAEVKAQLMLAIKRAEVRVYPLLTLPLLTV